MPSGAGTFTIASLRLIDAGREPASFKIYAPVLNAGNFVAKTALWATLVGAAMALVLGAKASVSYGDTTDYLWTLPANGAAREVALRISYVDGTTGQKFTTKLPTLDPTIPTYVDNAAARDVILIDAPTAVADFVTAFNAIAVNPYTGNACRIYGIAVARGGK